MASNPKKMLQHGQQSKDEVANHGQQSKDEVANHG